MGAWTRLSRRLRRRGWTVNGWQLAISGWKSRARMRGRLGPDEGVGFGSPVEFGVVPCGACNIGVVKRSRNRPACNGVVSLMMDYAGGVTESTGDSSRPELLGATRLYKPVHEQFY
jgi:hypothetical protein